MLGVALGVALGVVLGVVVAVGVGVAVEVVDAVAGSGLRYASRSGHDVVARGGLAVGVRVAVGVVVAVGVGVAVAVVVAGAVVVLVMVAIEDEVDMAFAVAVAFGAGIEVLVADGAFGGGRGMSYERITCCFCGVTVWHEVGTRTQSCEECRPATGEPPPGPKRSKSEAIDMRGIHGALEVYARGPNDARGAAVWRFRCLDCQRCGEESGASLRRRLRRAERARKRLRCRGCTRQLPLPFEGMLSS